MEIKKAGVAPKELLSANQAFNAKYRAKHFPLTKKVMACENKQPEVGGKCGQTPQETMPRHPVSAVWKPNR